MSELTENEKSITEENRKVGRQIIAAGRVLDFNADTHWLSLDEQRIRNQRSSEEDLIFVQREVPYLVGECDNVSMGERPLDMLAYHWANVDHLKPLYTLSFKFETDWRISFIVPDSIEHSILSQNLCRLAIKTKSGYNILELDLKSYYDGCFHRRLQSSQKEGETLGELDDLEGAKAETRSRILSGTANKLESKEDQEICWSYFDRFRRESLDVINIYLTPTNQTDFIESEKERIKDEPYAWLYKSENPLATMYNHFKKKLFEENCDPIKIYQDITISLNEHKCENLACCTQKLFFLAMFSPFATSNGSRIVSHNIYNELEYVSVKGADPIDGIENFWKRIPWAFVSMYSETIGPGNIPSDPKKIFHEAPVWTGDLSEAKEKIQALLAEAYALKQSTIPPGAYHPISEGGFIQSVKLYEIQNEVIAVFVDREGGFMLMTCNPSLDAYNLRNDAHDYFYAAARAEVEETHPSLSGDEQYQKTKKLADEKTARLTVGFAYFLATLIRDFWVVEDRGSVFGKRIPSKKIPRLHSQRNSSVLVYLPRIRYSVQEKDRSDRLAYKTRKPHHVRGHLRKALNASS